ncbi:Oryzain alpha chain [Oopsacas minuta]|uniref:Oryzain alpha chain n=1 Tax=Oopsacas minuta TaxID=111878 RepID=A0AAV7K315_9METZ|nr:Oryzain alpha chain [Oopsacas minuta]
MYTSVTLLFLTAWMLSQCYQETKEFRDFSFVLCKDNKTECPEETTCCNQTNHDKKYFWDCCPFQNAVCCNKVNSCCPEKYKCNNEAKTCDLGKDAIKMRKLRREEKRRMDIDV